MEHKTIEQVDLELPVQALKAKYEGALESIRDHQQLCHAMKAENEALRQRVTELANKNMKRDLSISDYSDVEYVQAYMEAHFEDFDEVVADRDRLNSELDILKEELAAWRIGYGIK